MPESAPLRNDEQFSQFLLLCIKILLPDDNSLPPPLKDVNRLVIQLRANLLRIIITLKLVPTMVKAPLPPGDPPGHRAVLLCWDANTCGGHWDCWHDLLPA